MAKGTPYEIFVPQLQKIANIPDESKRASLLFGLHQVPAFREAFHKILNKEDE